jgi:hypothetical protein
LGLGEGTLEGSAGAESVGSVKDGVGAVSGILGPVGSATSTALPNLAVQTTLLLAFVRCSPSSSGSVTNFEQEQSSWTKFGATRGEVDA